jgi:hypothetical protein
MRKFFVVFAVVALIPVLALAQTTDQHKNDATAWTGFYAGLYVGGATGSSNAQTGTVVAASGASLVTSYVQQINSAGYQNLVPTVMLADCSLDIAGRLRPSGCWELRRTTAPL